MKASNDLLESLRIPMFLFDIQLSCDMMRFFILLNRLQSLIFCCSSDFAAVKKFMRNRTEVTCYLGWLKSWEASFKN